MGENMKLIESIKKISITKYFEFLINSVFVTFGALATLLTIYFMIYCSYTLITL